jgi:Arm DNA-binding domain
MVKITKRVVEAADAREKDYLIWDDELPGFGLRVLSSGKRSYVIQYRTRGRSRRYTMGLHGAWAPETARREARVCNSVGSLGVMILSKIASSITRRSP